MKQIQRIKELVKLLNHYRDEYYNRQNSEISDFEYDQLYDELSELEQETGFVMVISPTQTVGYEVKSELTKVKHNHPMLSLDKTKDVDDIIKFLDDKDGLVMPKMDGLTCSLRYLNGKLVSAETRGDGEIGEDILHCAKTIKNIPLYIDYKDELIIDGEVIISYDDFEKINSTLPKDQKYKHPRNLASGSIRQLDSKIAAERNLKFIVWKVVKGCNNSTFSECDSNSFFDRLTFAELMGFDVVGSYGLPAFYRDEQIIEHAIDTIKKWAKDNSYPIDGCVFSYDDIAYGDSLGATGHHLRSQYAYKFYDELYETKLLDIEWTMGKTNILTPTAIFQTVNIDGADVSKASLHNISIIKKLGLTNNCTVRVYKANQIIPQVNSCLQDGDSAIEIPEYCPICKGSTKVVKENESEVLMCTNPNCTGKKIALFEHFVSKKAMNIEGMSEATIEFLINKGWIHTFKDLYHLSEHKAEWQKCDGFGKRSVEKILDAVEKSRNVKLDNFITALSIDGIGKSTAKAIAEFFHYDFLNWYHNGVSQPFDYASFDGIGKTMCDDIQIFCAYNKVMIADLADEMTFIIEEKKQNDGVNLDGKTFCITGSLNHFANRDALIADIETHNGKFVSSISTKCNYLINNDSTSLSSKNKKAQALNIPIITEEEYLQMIKEE